MAKTDNLTDFLTDLADAIREKKGITEAINPQDFSGEIASIESGGGAVVSASISDVNFLDYDGTILYSYTKEQFLALSAMPELPTREGLVCQGWNWTLNDAKEYVADYGKQNIGAMYITDDGDTRLYIRIASDGKMTVPLCWNQTVANGVSIDWGDGSTIQTFTGAGNKNTTHTYAKPGDYVIRLKVADGCILGLGNGSSSYCIMGSSNTTNNRAYLTMLQKVEIGNGVTSIGDYAFYNCYSISRVVIPDSVTSIGSYAFCYCYSLESVSIPSSVTSISNSMFSYCYTLSSVSIPRSVTNLGTYAFYSCYSLPLISIPSDVTSIGDHAISACPSITSITIPSKVASLGVYAFYNSYGIAIFDFTKHTSVPTLENTNAFTNIPSSFKIKVPSSLLEEWKAATNWSTHASKIVAG